ncbi:MAG: tryptophanyl-tRNA synthetase [archaeon GW2011_AR17]|nr:MAG: tryptophanyl-tRNA synthetase [archaeon GW2011_AR17]MBS3154761.1 tryptophan--tRNA ligase [Candidatus Woesearchaeota archaeon]HIH15224.1 tryptophan--tRNA ligase [Nanoarchaeota archaeon]HIH59546.1 tryptophan--tRNA ligase [Nanoarchaeota archaeon]HII14174.1 tryptophan--tRNA ligase [Nanoarchaeota archaeon]
MQTVTPWEVKGTIDYERLIKEFGLQECKNLPKECNALPLFRRGIIFAQRDFARISEAIEKKKRFVVMTGLMPSGKFHFGHKMVAEQLIFYQSLGAKIYLTVADLEAYNSRMPDMKALRETAIQEYLTNYIALGLDLKKCDFYFQSKRSKEGKKSNAYYSLAAMFARHITFNEFKAIYGEISPGKMSSALLQAADMLHPQLPEFEGKPQPILIPVGADQDPHLRLARDASQRIKEYNFVQLSSTYHKFLPGLGSGKMSSSDPTSYIALTDTPEDAAHKIRKYAFSGGQATLEEHRKKGGNPDVDVSFQMLRYGLEPDDKKLKNISDEYKSGKLLTGELKAITIEKITSFLKGHQKKREKAKKQVDKFLL